MNETNQLPYDDKINEHHRDISSGKKRRILVLLLLSILISYAPKIFGYLLFVEGDLNKSSIILSELLSVLSNIIMIALVVGMWRFTIIPRISMQWLGEKKSSTILGVIALPVILKTTDVILRQIFNRLGINICDIVVQYQHSANLFLAEMILIVLVTPIVEEIFWRGYIQGILERVSSRSIAVFLQAVLFALLHMVGIAGRFNVFVIGLILGLWRCWKRTLIPLIVAHMVFNSFFFARLLCNYFEERTVKVTYDYRKQLENRCRPVDYLPENNALPYYKRAIELLVEPTDERFDVMMWPNDMTDEVVASLRNWISVNDRAIAEFEIGSKKPYCFREYSKESIGKLYALPIEGSALMTIIVLSRAEISAAQGDFQSSVSDILTVYRFGQHFAAPKPLVEQVMGLEMKELTLSVAFFILEKSEPSEIYLTELQLGLKDVSERKKIPIDFTLERLFFYDVIQRNFTNDGKGSGRIPRAFFDDRGKPDPILQYLGCPENDKDQIRRWRNLDRRQTVQITDSFFTRLLYIKNLTPVQLHRRGIILRDYIQKSAMDNVFVLALTKTFAGDYHYAYRLKAQKDALIVIVAIMRYQLARGDLPDELEQLVQAGYLDSIPLDPYSDTPFVYKKKGSGFLLYSLGRDFDDDGGIRSSPSEIGGDNVFWPVGDLFWYLEDN